VVLTAVQRAIYCAVCWCVGFREVVRWKEMFVYCTGIELSGSNMAAQRNFNCLNHKDNKNKVHFPFTHPEGIWRSGGIAPHIHTLSTTRMWIVSLTPSNGKVGMTVLSFTEHYHYLFCVNWLRLWNFTLLERDRMIYEPQEALLILLVTGYNTNLKR